MVVHGLILLANGWCPLIVLPRLVDRDQRYLMGVEGSGLSRGRDWKNGAGEASPSRIASKPTTHGECTVNVV